MQRVGHVGRTPEQILETVIPLVQYAGSPKALNAIKVVTDELTVQGCAIPEALGPQG